MKCFISLLLHITLTLFLYFKLSFECIIEIHNINVILSQSVIDQLNLCHLLLKETLSFISVCSLKIHNLVLKA